MTIRLAKFPNGVVESVTIRDFESPLGKGATATVYSASINHNSTFAAKIYHEPQALDLKRIVLLTEKNPLSKDNNNNGEFSFAWPIAQILDSTTYEPLGFLMNKVGLAESYPLSAAFVSPIRASNKMPHWPLNLRCEIARRLCEATEKLHLNFFLITDFKPENIRITKNGSITFLDCDSFGIDAPGFRVSPTHFSAGYISPELLRQNSGPQAASFSQDLFALGVLLFKLLNYGLHPFQGILINSPELPSDDDKVREGLYAYGLSQSPRINPTPISIHHCLPAELRSLFDRCFTCEHNRPTASEWASEFAMMFQSTAFSKCTVFPTDVNHIHFSSYNCSACQLEALKSKRSDRIKKSSASVGNEFNRTESINSAQNSGDTGLSKVITFLVVVIALLAVPIILSITNKPMPGTVSPASPEQSISVKKSDPSVPNSQRSDPYGGSAGKSNKELSISELRISVPNAYDSQLLTIEELRWCIIESRWIDSSRNYTFEDLEGYKKTISFYNQRCARKFLVSDNEQAEKEITRLTLAIQQELNKIGYEVGAIDGIFGVQTANAIVKYSEDRGEPYKGLSSELLLELRRKSR